MNNSYKKFTKLFFSGPLYIVSSRTRSFLEDSFLCILPLFILRYVSLYSAVHQIQRFRSAIIFICPISSVRILIRGMEDCPCSFTFYFPQIILILSVFRPLFLIMNASVFSFMAATFSTPLILRFNKIFSFIFILRFLLFYYDRRLSPTTSTPITKTVFWYLYFLGSQWINLSLFVLYTRTYQERVCTEFVIVSQANIIFLLKNFKPYWFRV